MRLGERVALSQKAVSDASVFDPGIVSFHEVSGFRIDDGVQGAFASEVAIQSGQERLILDRWLVGKFLAEFVEDHAFLVNLAGPPQLLELGIEDIGPGVGSDVDSEQPTDEGFVDDSVIVDERIILPVRDVVIAIVTFSRGGIFA